MDLSDFLQGEQPISYKKAKEYFARDPAQKWVIVLLYLDCIIIYDCLLVLINMEIFLDGPHMSQGQFWC